RARAFPTVIICLVRSSARRRAVDSYCAPAGGLLSFAGAGRGGLDGSRLAIELARSAPPAAEDENSRLVLAARARAPRRALVALVPLVRGSRRRRRGTSRPGCPRRTSSWSRDCACRTCR